MQIIHQIVLFIYKWFTCQIERTLMIHQNNATLGFIDVRQTFHLVGDA